MESGGGERFRRPDAAADGAPHVGGRAASGDESGLPEAEPRTEASVWVREKPQRRLVDAPTGVQPPERPREPVVEPKVQHREPSMVPLAIGVTVVAALACIPHWVAPTVALMLALVGVPMAWAFRRISHGRRRVQYLVVVASLLICAALAVIAPLLWVEAGVLRPLELPGLTRAP